MSDETKKEQTRALTVVPRAGSGMVLRTVDDHKQFALAAWAAGVLDEGDKTKAVGAALCKMQYGAELGLGPMSSLAGVHLIKGKPSLGAGIIAARIQAHPLFRFRQAELSDTRCRLVFFERDHEQAPWLEVGDSVYTIEDSKRACLFDRKQRDGGPNMWHKHPRSMLFARALTDGARRFCPIVFSGSVYTPEELGDDSAIDVDYTEEPEPFPREDLSGPPIAVDPPQEPDPFEGLRTAEEIAREKHDREVEAEIAARNRKSSAKPAPDESPPEEAKPRKPPADALYPGGPSPKQLERMREYAALKDVPKSWRDKLTAMIGLVEAKELGAGQVGKALGAVKDRLRGKADPAVLDDAAKKKAAGGELASLWAQAAELRTRVTAAGLHCAQLDALWRGGTEGRSADDILAGIAAGKAALDRSAAENDPGEPPADPLAAVIAELHTLAESPHADGSARYAIGKLIDLHDKGKATLAEATDLRDSLAQYIAERAEEDARLF